MPRSTRTVGCVERGTGTSYGIIRRLLADGLVVESKRRPAAAHDDGRRRYYRLTPVGRLVVVAETTRLEAMVDAGAVRIAVSWRTDGWSTRTCP